MFDAQRPGQLCQSMCLEERVVVHQMSQDVAAHTTSMHSMNRMHPSISPGLFGRVPELMSGLHRLGGYPFLPAAVTYHQYSIYIHELLPTSYRIHINGLIDRALILDISPVE